MFPQSSRLMTKRGRPLIRAILFIVRLRRDVQAQHRRRTTRKRMGGLANAAGRLRQAREPGGAVGGQREDRPGLIRCESSRRPQRELQRQQQHRNSAPSAVFLRSPTPQPMVGPDSVELAAVVDIGSEFESFVRMPQPYQLRLDKNGSQLGLHSSTAHQLAARAMFRRSRGLTGMGGSLDQQSATNGGGRTSSAELASRLLSVHRQGSVETAASAGKCPSGVNGGGLAAADLPRRKLKAGMVGLIGALTALEQGDLEALGAVLSRNGSQQQQLEFRLDEPLEGGLYALFEPRLRLLDVALMLGRPRAVEMLMEHGAVDLAAEVPSVMQRRAAVEATLVHCEQKAREQHERPKEEEKRRLQLDAQLAILRRMRAHLSSRHSLPLAPSNVRATCTSPCAVCIQFEPTESSDDVDDDGGCMAIASSSSPIVRARVEWSRCSDFSSLEGTKEVRDIRSSKIVVFDLPLGEQFAFRVSLASIWGWGPPRQAEPNVLRISSWTELENTEQGKLDPKELADLVEEVERHRQGPVWQRIFPSCSSAERDRKRKTGLKHLFSASSKFVKNVQRGLFLATIFYTESRILCTVDDCLPVICVDESSQGLASDELHWLMKLSMCWEQLPMLQESLGSCASGSANCQLRARLLDAAVAMHNALGVRDIGRVHHIPVQPQPGTCLLVTVRLLAESSSGEAQGLAMRWMRLEKLLRRRQACPALECLSRELLPLLNFFESSQICLQPGLYLAYLRLQSSLNSIHVLVPENLTSALPFAQIRQNSHVTHEEWAHLQALARLDEKPSSGSPEEKKPPTDAQRKFHEELARAARMLVMDLELDPEQLLGTRLFRHRLVQLDEQVSLVLVMPRAEEVCQVNCPATTAAAISTRESSGSIFALGSMAQFRGCISVPVPVFQMVNLCAYQPDFLSAYCALSVFLDHFQMVAQHEQRACLVENDARVYADQLEQLGLFQHRLKAIWRSARWISCFASVARERGGAHRNCSLRLTRLLRPADDQSPAADFLSSNGGGRDRLASVLARRNGLVPSLSPLRPHSQQSGSCCSLSAGQSFSCGSSPAPSAKTSLVQSMAGCSLPGTPPADQQRAAQLDGQLQLLEAGSPTEQQPPAQTSGVLRVFAAFDTGLAQKGVSVRLRVFADTKAAEVVQLVVRQVARIRLCGGGEELMPSAKASSPSSASNSPDPGQHCLVSVVGTRERRFTDEFPVLRMGQPWERGRLCVRHIRQIGAAIKLANETAV